jgi:N-acetylneuraminic acid mutarotase
MANRLPQFSQPLAKSHSPRKEDALAFRVRQWVAAPAEWVKHMSWEASNRRARAFRAAIGATVESLESRQLFAAVPQVSIAATDPIASEVGLDTGTYRITRSGNLSSPLVVNLIVGGRATNGVDYGTIGNAITLAAGQSTFDFLVRPVSDGKVEPTESITVSLGASSAYTINPDAPLGNVLLKDGGGATLAEIGFFKANVNFQPYDVPVPSGYIVDGGSGYKKQSNGKTYGWSASKTLDTRDRDASNAYDQRYDTFIHTGDAAWNMAVPNGTYLVHLVAGDPENFDSTYNFIVEGKEVISGKPNSGTRFLDGTETVTVTDGTITIRNGSGAANNKLMFANITQLTDAAGRELGVPLVSFADAHADAAEPNDPGVWRVRRIGSTAQALTVKYTVGGSATNGKDYETLSGTLTIPADEDDVELRIDTIDDSDIESLELVTVSLVGSAGYLIGGDVDAVCKIVDTDHANGITWKAVASSPIDRAEALGGVINDKLYVFGGLYSDGDDNILATTRSDVYDPTTNKWTRIADVPEKVTHAGTVIVGDTFWFIGGYFGNHPGPGGRHVWRYNTTSDSWSRGPDLPDDRGAGAAALIGRTIHFVGGLDDTRGEDLADHWALDLDNLSEGWERRKSLPSARNHTSAASLGGFMYVIGGQKDEEELQDPLNSVYRYDPSKDTWTRVANLPAPRSHTNSSTFVMDGRIVILGGENGFEQVQRTVYAYDPVTNTWARMSDLPSRRSTSVAGVLSGNRIISATGNSPVSSASIWIGTVS